MTPSSVSEEAQESETTPQETSTSHLSDQVSSVVEVKTHRSSPGTSQLSPGTHPVKSEVSPVKSVEEESVVRESESKRLTFTEDDTSPQSGLKDAVGRSGITTVLPPSPSPSTNYVTQRLGELEDYSSSERYVFMYDRSNDCNVHVNTHTYVRTYVQMCICVCTQVHTYVLTYNVHAHARAHTHTQTDRPRHTNM